MRSTSIRSVETLLGYRRAAITAIMPVLQLSLAPRRAITPRPPYQSRAAVARPLRVTACTYPMPFQVAHISLRKKGERMQQHAFRARSWWVVLVRYWTCSGIGLQVVSLLALPVFDLPKSESSLILQLQAFASERPVPFESASAPLRCADSGAAEGCLCSIPAAAAVIEVAIDRRQ